MKDGIIYRHRRCVDIDIYVIEVDEECTDEISTVVLATLFNRRNKLTYETKWFIINSEELYNWRQVND